MINEAMALAVMKGMITGDLIDAHNGAIPELGSLRSSAAGQLACVTLEGLIRADVRGALRGSGSPRDIVRSSFVRFALRQGIASPKRNYEPHGWISSASFLDEDRGAGEELAHLLPQADGGHHLLPTSGYSVVACASLAGLYEPSLKSAADLGRGIAETLTKNEETVLTASVGAALLSGLRQRLPIGRLLDFAGSLRKAGPESPSMPDVASCESLQSEVLRPPALSAALMFSFHAAQCVAMSPRLIFDIGRSAPLCAAMTGAFAGAIDSKCMDDISLWQRSEAAPVAEILAVDFVRQVLECPAGTEYSAASDPEWEAKYPPW